MHQASPVMTTSFFVGVVFFGMPGQAAEQAVSPKAEKLDGEWKVQVDTRGGPRTSMLSFSRNPEGRPTGQWIGLYRLSELKDIKYEGGLLSFTREGRNREGRPRTWKFKGTIKGGKLSGTVSGDGDRIRVEGKRIPPLPDVVGNWVMGYSGDRVSSMLAVRRGDEGKLTATWKSDGGEIQIADFSYKERTVTFTLKDKIGDNQKGLAYEGGLRNANTLDGVFKSDKGPTPVAAFRMGTAVIGAWELEIQSDRGSRKQRLKVRPDMSGWYGPAPIKKVKLEDDNPLRRSKESRSVTFDAFIKAGDRSFEIHFDGVVKASQVSGEITTPRGKMKVVGKKAEPPSS